MQKERKTNFVGRLIKRTVVAISLVGIVKAAKSLINQSQKAHLKEHPQNVNESEPTFTESFIPDEAAADNMEVKS